MPTTDPLAAFDAALATAGEEPSAPKASKREEFHARRARRKAELLEAGAAPGEIADKFADPTAYERTASSAINLGVGTGEGVAMAATIPVDVALDTLTAGPLRRAAKAIGTYLGGGEPEAEEAPTPTTNVVTKAGDAVAAFDSKMAGIREGVITDLGDAVARTVGQTVGGELGGRLIPLVPKGKRPSATPGVFDADQYVAEQISKREAARTAAKPSPPRVARAFLANAKAKMVDFAAPIEDVLNDAIKEHDIKLKPSEHITNQIDRSLRAPTIAGQFARDGGLDAVIQETPSLDHLDQYLIAKHAQSVEANGIKTGRDLVSDAKLVDALAPEYEPLAQRVRDYTHHVLDYSVDSGLISSDLAEKLKTTYPEYVPLTRVFNELERTSESGGTKAIASLSKQSVVRRLVGSEREIESPLESLLQKTYDAVVQGEKNKAARMLASYRDLPGDPFQIEEVERGAGAHAHTFSFLDEGTKRTFATTREVAGAAKALDVQQMNILGKILAAPVRVARAGITGLNVPFLAANIAKDQVTAAINSRYALATSLANPKNFMRSLFEAVNHGDLYDEMAREGATGTAFDIARDQARQSVQQMRAARSLPTKIAYTVTHPSQLWRAAENVLARGEELTRIQQYLGTREKLIRSGIDEAEARIEAARAARENTVNFARRGEFGSVLNNAFLYLNAQIQGTRTLLRSLRERPAATGAKIATVVFLPVAAATAWNLSDEKRRAAYEDIATFEKENNIIIVPPDPSKDEKGRWNVIKIPLSQEVNNLASIPRREMEAAHGFDPVRFHDVARALIGTVSPITPDKGSILSTLTPQAIRPTLQAGVNKDFFTGREIVPSRMERALSPKDQVNPNTSGTARKIGAALNVSPIKVEHFVRATAGGLGAAGLNAFDRALAAAGAIPPSQIGGEDIVQGTTRRFGKAFGGQKLRDARERAKPR